MHELFVHVVTEPENSKQKRYFSEGDEAWIRRFIPRKDFLALFGGFHLSPQADESDGDGFREFIGVVGKRKCARLRRVLHERGAQFRTVEDQSWETRSSKVEAGARRLRRLVRETEPSDHSVNPSEM